MARKANDEHPQCIHCSIDMLHESDDGLCGFCQVEIPLVQAEKANAVSSPKDDGQTRDDPASARF